MKFEIGKYYEHTTGKKLHIITGYKRGESVMSMGPGLVAEEPDGGIVLVGSDEESAMNHTETPPWTFPA